VFSVVSPPFVLSSYQDDVPICWSSGLFSVFYHWGDSILRPSGRQTCWTARQCHQTQAKHVSTHCYGGPNIQWLFSLRKEQPRGSLILSKSVYTSWLQTHQLGRTSLSWVSCCWRRRLHTFLCISLHNVCMRRLSICGMGLILSPAYLLPWDLTLWANRERKDELARSRCNSSQYLYIYAKNMKLPRHRQVDILRTDVADFFDEYCQTMLLRSK
jgi:hypothetical protein